MSEKITEDSHAEQPALEWLGEVGWEASNGTTLAPDAGSGERSSYRDVVLQRSLYAAVARLNPRLPDDAVTRVVELVRTNSHPDVVHDHQAFHGLLLEGVPVSWRGPDGAEQFDRARIVDFDEPAANRFVAVNQLTILGGGNVNRRPDVLLYVNGLPLAQLELKSPAAVAGPKQAANQVRNYVRDIRDLYRYVEVIGVSDLLRARVGTLTTSASHFAEWKAMDPERCGDATQLEILIRSVLTPTDLLDLVRNFVLFETDGAKTWKVMAKYHQVDAVKRAVASTADAMASDGRAGVVWHTQGAGKSYSMVFFVTKLRRDKRFRNPTVVCVTDTNDLDNQLAGTFARQSGLRDAVKQADSIKSGPRSLHQLLDVEGGGIVFTTIQKFGRGKDEPPMPVINDRRNVVVIADEAHRSQYDTLAQNLQRALPNATRIGFTGTPIELADKSTRTTFGDYISVYRMSQAQADDATVPIYYEARQVPVEVDQAKLDEIQRALDEESEDAETALASEFARIERIVGAPKRVDRVVTDIAAHYEDRIKTMPGKAMVVTYSKRLAAEYADRLREVLGDDAVDAVMSADAHDDERVGRYRKNKQQLREVEKRFKDPVSSLRVIVVKNMWLTGFDAPILHTLYVDKPMRDHGLLQAIARVNRVFEGKDGGLVVDYIGIGDDLRNGLKAYAQGDVEDVVIPLAMAQKKLAERHEVMCELLRAVRWRPPDGATLGEQATMIGKAAQQAVEPLALDEAKAKSYLHEQALYVKWFRLVSPNPPSDAQRLDHDFFAIVAKLLREVMVGGDDPDPDVTPRDDSRRRVEQLFSEGLSGGEVIDVFAMADERRPELSVLSDEFLSELTSKVPQPNLQLALLRKLLDGEIRTHLAGNVTQRKHFSEELNAAIARYTAGQRTSAETIAKLIELVQHLRAQHERNARLGLSSEEVAFYDALIGSSGDLAADEDVKALVTQIVPRLHAVLDVDWLQRSNLNAKVRRTIRRVLRAPENRPTVDRIEARATRTSGGGDLVDRLFEQAKLLYKRWPDVEGMDAHVF